ncbi:uncharacterized protein METZ01_LOCUS249046, partial [marine metagenome]
PPQPVIRLPPAQFSVSGHSVLN